MENLIGQMVHVVVSKGGKTATKLLKVCKVKARSVLFIEVDRENRKNIFRKVNNKDITTRGTIGDSPYIYIKEGVLPTKWESDWDAIGVRPSFGYTPRPNYGRMATAAKGFSHDVLAVSVSNRSTTNSAAGFPMV